MTNPNTTNAHAPSPSEMDADSPNHPRTSTAIRLPAILPDSRAETERVVEKLAVEAYNAQASRHNLDCPGDLWPLVKRLRIATVCHIGGVGTETLYHKVNWTQRAGKEVRVRWMEIPEDL